jgi:hypothetical protein
MKNYQQLINVLLLHGLVFNGFIAPALVVITIIQNQDIFTYNEWVYSIGINIFFWQLLSIKIRENQIAMNRINLFSEVKKNPILHWIHNRIYTIYRLLSPSMNNLIISGAVFCSFAFIVLYLIITKNSVLFIIVEWVVFLQCWRILFIYADYLSNQKQSVNANKTYTFWISDVFFSKTI